jgi:hypothetical protein
VQDVLGLITELTQQSGCKVAVIFNQDKLGEASATYKAYREKLVDIEVPYEPTVHESFNLVFDDAECPQRDEIFKRVEYLSVTNVRILRRLDQSIKLVLTSVKNLHVKAVQECIASTALFVWCTYAADELKPNIEEILDWNASFFQPKKDVEIEHWVQRLRAYGFSLVKPLDLCIAEVVRRGYVEGTGFVEEVKKYDEKLRCEDNYEKPLEKVWRRFGTSFSDDQESFINDFVAAVKGAIGTIHTDKLNEAVRLLRDLKQDSVADELIDQFIQSRKADPLIFNLEAWPVFAIEIDPGLQEKFAQIFQELTPLPSLKESLNFFAKQNFEPKHLEVMQQASMEAYKAEFLEPRDDDMLFRLIAHLMTTQNPKLSGVPAKIGEVLKAIESMSLLNAVRVKKIRKV